MANTNIHVREKVLTNNFFNEVQLTPISYSTETTRNGSNLNIDAEKQRDRIHCSPLVHSDISMRYSLWLLGLHSAPCSLFRAKLSVPLQVFCTAWHLVTLLILLIGIICGLIYGWNNKEDFNLHRLGRLIAHLSINTFVAFTSVGYFFLGRMRRGLALYYKTLADLEDYFKDMCIDLSVKRIRNVIIAIVFVSWLGTLANMGLRVLDFKDSDYDDVMVGSRIESTASASFLLALKTISRTALTVLSLQWMPCQGYYATICTTVWVLASDYNLALDKEIENSPTKVLDNLEKYRQAHLKICNLVECVDSLLKWNFGILISLMTVVLLCVLYMASVTSFTTYIYYVLMAVASLATLIFFCDKVVDSTRGSYNSLQNLMQTDYPFTNRHVYQMQLFLNRVEHGEVLTAAGLLDINKEFGLTLAGITVSYYVMMVQFHSMTINPATSGFTNCTNYSMTTLS